MVGRMSDPNASPTPLQLSREWIGDRLVLLIIAGGLIAILLSIVWGLFLNTRSLPNWAENVLVSIATATALKLGDSLSTLVALASGKQLAASRPLAPPSADTPAPDDPTGLNDPARPAGTPDDPVHTTEEPQP
jgi:hypothetical protein